MKIGIVAGEASGDLLGAKLIIALREIYPDLEVEGVAGPAMVAAGCKRLFDIERLSVVGLIEPLKRLPDLLRLRRAIRQHFLKNRPDIFIGIDAPDFNVGLEAIFKNAGITTIHYVSPSVWAWRQWRVKKIKRAVDMMLTVFPFEAKFYEQHQVPVRYVGHPLAAQFPLQCDTVAARSQLHLENNVEYVALLPGSRRQEIHHLAEPMIKAAIKILESRPYTRFLTSHINDERAALFKEYLQRIAPNLPISIFVRRTQEVMAASNLVIVSSGTATLETMFAKKPMLIVYKLAPITYRIVSWLYKAAHIGLPNLLANKRLVPELMQDAVTPDNIANEVLSLLSDPDRMLQIRETFTSLHQELSIDSSTRLRAAVTSLL